MDQVVEGLHAEMALGIRPRAEGGSVMIQWCQDCKHDYGFDDWQAEYCDACLENSDAGQKPIGYEQIEQEDE